MQPMDQRTALSFPALHLPYSSSVWPWASYRPLVSASPSLWWGQWHGPHGAATRAQGDGVGTVLRRHLAHSEGSCHHSVPAWLGHSSMHPSCLGSNCEPPTFRSGITSQLLSRFPPDQVKGPGASPSAMDTGCLTEVGAGAAPGTLCGPFPAWGSLTLSCSRTMEARLGMGASGLDRSVGDSLWEPERASRQQDSVGEARAGRREAGGHTGGQREPGG